MAYIPKFQEPPSRRAPAALLLALLLHFSTLFLPKAELHVPSEPSAPQDAIEVSLLQEPAPPPPEPPPPIAPTPPRTPTPAAEKTAPAPVGRAAAKQHAQARVTGPDEQSADLDALMAEEFETPKQWALAPPKAARIGIIRKGSPGAIGTASGPPGGGPGGTGTGLGPGRVVTEKFAFGGPEGAFKADVCAIPKRTASLNQITNCPHLLTFFTDRINVPSSHFKVGFPGVPDRVEWFAIKYTGAFTVRHPGLYTFKLISDDGSRLYIDGQLIVDNDGSHAPRSRYGKALLEAGTHQLKLKYFQGPGSLLALQLFAARPGRHEKLFRPEL